MSGVLDALKKGDTSALIDLIKADGPVIKIISWPKRDDVKVAIKVLSASESRMAKIDNQQEFKKAGIEISMHNLGDYRSSEAAHGMWRSILDSSTNEPIFKSVEAFRDFLTDDEISYFVNQYNSLSLSNDPCAEELSDEDYEDLIEHLKKKPAAIASKVTSLPIAWKLLRIMVEKLPN